MPQPKPITPADALAALRGGDRTLLAEMACGAVVLASQPPPHPRFDAFVACLSGSPVSPERAAGSRGASLAG